MITRINQFVAAEGKAQELYEFLLSLADFITESEGNEYFEVLKNSADDSKLVVIEKWQSEAHHQQSLANYPQDEMQKAMALFGAPPTGDYYTSD